MLSPDDLDFQAALAGQYSLDRELGRGGMGIVYLAREALLDRPVAIKRLPTDLADDEQARERFLREARTAAQLFHPNIIPIHRVDALGRFVFFAMGYVEGETVGQLVRRRGPVTADEATRILRDAAFALGYGHARGVVHRDVKPDNLLIEKASGRTLVTDFGIAQQEGAAGMTRDGQLLGSVHYMSPEQISGGTVDGRSDVYALGAVAHFLLTGRPPFDNPAATAVLGMHLNTPAPAISSVARGIPQRLASAIDRCLAKDPAARFATAEAFAEALSDVEGKRAVSAPLRAWTKGAGLLDAGLAIISVVVLIFIIQTSNFWLLGVPVVYAITQRLRVTRQLLVSGHDAEDLAAALVAEVERHSEEAASQVDAKPSRLVRPLRWIAGLSAAAFVGSVGVFSWLPSHIQNLSREVGEPLLYGSLRMIGISFVTGVTAALLAEVISPSRGFGGGSGDLKWRLRFWRSRAGHLLAKLLRRGSRAVARADADRPTEVIVGTAVASLFEALPRDARKQLAGLPVVVERLETRARELRVRREKLDRLATAAKPVRARVDEGDLDRLRAETVDELGAARAKIDQQLATTIVALETIRLDLLRLHAGRGSTADLTAALAAASAIGDDVAVTIESRGMVEDLLAG